MKVQVHQLSVPERLRINNWQASGGECWFLLGANGAGKTTLLNCIAGLEQDYQGQLAFSIHDELETTYPFSAAHLAFLQQYYPLGFSLTGRELLEFYVGSRDVPAQIENSLHIKSLLHSALEQLSSGQLQRLQIARVLMQVWPAIEQGNACILLDEPTQNLDIPFQEKTLSLLAQLASTGNAVVIAHHDVNHCFSYATQVACLLNGEMIEQGSPDTLLTEALVSRIYDFPFTLAAHEQAQHKYFIRGSVLR